MNKEQIEAAIQQHKLDDPESTQIGFNIKSEDWDSLINDIESGAIGEKEDLRVDGLREYTFMGITVTLVKE